MILFSSFSSSGGNTGYPALAPPVVKKGAFVLSQTPAIMRYLGRLYGLAPENPEDEYATILCFIYVYE